jgi:hypothetical protein
MWQLLHQKHHGHPVPLAFVAACSPGRGARQPAHHQGRQSHSGKANVCLIVPQETFSRCHQLCPYCKYPSHGLPVV